MSLDLTAIIASVADHALNLGIFERVNQFEPNTRPAFTGVSAHVIVQSLSPLNGRSGLAASSASLVCLVNLYTSGDSEPREYIDPKVTSAASQLINAYVGDLDLASNISDIDVRGAFGTAMSATSGWIQIDGSRMRVMQIVLPLIIDDVWSEAR